MSKTHVSNQVFVKAGAFATRVLAGQTILVPVKGNAADLDSIYTLDEVASRIWGLMDARATIGQIADTLEQEFEVAPEQALEDVVGFLASLQAEGLIEPRLEGEK
ncbi:MAG: PqqD family protein [Thermoanaerobaculia bacterium]